jgi:hypothetical protein
LQEYRKISSSRAYVNMRVPSGRIAAMRVLLLLDFDRHHDDSAVTHAALRDNALGEMSNFVGSAAQQGHLHAAFMIEMDVHGGERQIVMLVERTRQAFRQLARLVVVDVDKSRDALSRAAGLLVGLPYSGAGEVADRLGSILMAARFYHAVDLGHELVVEGDRHTLHDGNS